MAAKIEIVDNALVITDTDTGMIMHDVPAKDHYYNNTQLKKGNVQIYDVYGLNEDLAKIFTDSLANTVDENDVVFTDTTFRDFARLNLGKSSPQASGIFSEMIVERLINSESAALTQSPTGLGAVNAKQIEYGAAVGTISDDVMMTSDGVLTFNKAGSYRIKISLQFGRSGNPSSSVLLFRVTDINGVQLGRSIGYLISSSDETNYLENDTWLTVPAGFVVKSEVMRDASGINAGGLVSISPTDEGVGTWNFVPTAAIRVLKFT